MNHISSLSAALIIGWSCLLQVTTSNPPQDSASSSNLSAIVVKQMRPKWEVQSLGQSTATASDSEFHVAIAASSPDVVKRQRVNINSTDGGTTALEFGPEGGIAKLTKIAIDSSVTVLVTVEFVPELGLDAVIKQYKSTATSSGAIGLFQLLSDQKSCFVDPGAWPRNGDYLTCQLISKVGDKSDSKVKHLLKTAGSTVKLETSEFVVVCDKEEQEISVLLSGRLGGAVATVVGEFRIDELEEAGVLIPTWMNERCRIAFRPIQSGVSLHRKK